MLKILEEKSKLLNLWEDETTAASSIHYDNGRKNFWISCMIEFDGQYCFYKTEEDFLDCLEQNDDFWDYKADAAIEEFYDICLTESSDYDSFPEGSPEAIIKRLMELVDEIYDLNIL